MPTAVLVLPTGDPTPQLEWASLLAAAMDDDLIVVYVGPLPKTGHPAYAIEKVEGSAVPKTVQHFQTTAGTISQVVRLDEKRLADAAQSAIEHLHIDRLLIPREPGERIEDDAFRDRREILQRVTCEIVQLGVGATRAAQCQRVLVAAGPGEATDEALRLAAAVAQHVDGHARAVYVERDSSDLAMHVAQRAVERHVADSVQRYRDRVDVEVFEAADVTAGLREAAEGYGLILLGASHHHVLHRWLFSSVSEKLMGNHQGPTVGIIRPALTWTSRLAQSVTRLVHDTVPQLDRSSRLNLFERIQGASQWNFDFAALISLSTLIATLGLLQDSAAVVIGAMLVAPLMTPLLGIGLAITQGNSTLGRSSTRTVALGFLCSYLIGSLTATCVPDAPITSQVASRGSPGVIDLLVAFVSGVAAAYAVGRPNLLSALPGVAIAAALVPPVGASAIGLSRFDFGLAWGACLLFLTNIVAIVLGAALSFWLSGIRVLHSHGGMARWSRPVATALLAVALGLAIYESLPTQGKLGRLRAQAAETLSRVPGAKLENVSFQHDREKRIVRYIISAPQPISQEICERLTKQAAETLPHAHQIDIQYQRVWRSSLKQQKTDPVTP